ncbi:MAG: L-histidine N(alpha)-methyltransferase [Gammaproteobacteria bacterium]|nr:L-histidine N(alpha)-methyltransferase [Gammaproteobacteria bacterium]
MNNASSELDLQDFHPDRAAMMKDVMAGLTDSPKWLSSMYFYDERGSQLFDEICELPEYYPTRTEIQIVEDNIHEISDLLGPHAMLIEPGAGSAVKIRILLENMDDPAAYVPVEISREHLMASAEKLAEAFPGIEILPVCADFTSDFDLPEPSQPALRNIVYFPGSTIGNFDPEDAIDLLKVMHKLAGDGGAVLLGVDLEKDRDILVRAYNDATGVTAKFNLNVLDRLNRELGADFDRDAFRHEAVWNESRHRIEMHLFSEREQDVHIGGKTLHFDKGESIHTESSYKYTLDRFAKLAAQAGFTVEKAWTDARDMFSVQYLRPSD